MTKKEIIETIKDQIDLYRERAELASNVTADETAQLVTESIVVMCKKLGDFIDTIEIEESAEIDFADALSDYILNEIDGTKDIVEDDEIIKLIKYFYNLGLSSK